MTTCQECKATVSCGCSMKVVPNRPYAVCTDCLKKLLDEIETLKKQGKEPEVRTPNIQGV